VSAMFVRAARRGCAKGDESVSAGVRLELQDRRNRRAGSRDACARRPRVAWLETGFWIAS